MTKEKAVTISHGDYEALLDKEVADARAIKHNGDMYKLGLKHGVECVCHNVRTKLAALMRPPVDSVGVDREKWWKERMWGVFASWWNFTGSVMDADRYHLARDAFRAALTAPPPANGCEGCRSHEPEREESCKLLRKGAITCSRWAADFYPDHYAPTTEPK